MVHNVVTLKFQFDIFLVLSCIGDFWLGASFSTTLPLSAKCANIKMGPLIRKLSLLNQTHLWSVSMGNQPCPSMKRVPLQSVTTYEPPCRLNVTNSICYSIIQLNIHSYLSNHKWHQNSNHISRFCIEFLLYSYISQNFNPNYITFCPSNQRYHRLTPRYRSQYDAAAWGALHHHRHHYSSSSAE